MISIDAYSFLAFSELTCHLEDAGIGVFWLHCLEKELQSSDQEAFLSPGKHTRLVLEECHAWRCVSTVMSSDEDIPEVPGCHWLQQINFPVSVTKITSMISVSWTHSLLFWPLPLFPLNEMAISKLHTADTFESHISLKLSFTNIQGFLF